MTRRRVQAIILAGGFGTRLYPLTETKPKPLVKIVDKTVLDMVIESVLKTQTEVITLSTCHFSDMIQKECERYTGQIECVREETPLGTAGGVKNCVKEGFDAYLVVSGDGVFDFDLQKVLDKHFEREPYVTIVCTNKSDPTGFGTVRCTEDGEIYEINEKPAWKNVKTDLVNTGIYVLSPKAVKLIPDGKTYDFSKQLFCELLKNKLSLFAITLDGFWCDIGTLEEYKNCNKAAISRQCLGELFKDIRQTAKEGFEITPDSYVYKNAVVGRNASIRNKSVICKNVSIGENCEISDSIISSGSVVGKGSGIYGAIVGENVTVGENCIIPEGCVLGDGSIIKGSSVLKKGTLVKSSAVVYREDSENMVCKDVKNMFVEDGICVFYTGDILLDVAQTATATALCFTKPDKRPARICVGCDSNSDAFRSAYTAGALRTGAHVTELEKCDVNILTFCSCFLPYDVFVYIQTSNKDKVKLYILEKYAANLSDENERKIIKNLEKVSGELNVDSQTQKQDKLCFAEVNHIDVTPVYFSFLEELCEDLGLDAASSKPRISLSGYKNQLSPSFEVLKSLLLHFGFEFCYGVDNALKISFSQNIDECFVRYKNTGIDKSHIEAVVLNNLECLEVKPAKISKNSPRVLQKLAQSIKESEQHYKKMPRMFELFENDACVMLISLFCVCIKRDKKLDELLCEIPDFEVYTDVLVADVNKAGTMKKLGNLYKVSDSYRGDGISLSLSKGNVTIIPSRAKGFKVISEAANMEAAKELCLDIEKIIKEKS